MGIKSAKAKKRLDKKQSTNGSRSAQVVLKDEFQEYGRITKICGNCRFLVLLPDMKEYIGVLCKRMYKRAWIGMDQIVLVSRRDFQADRVDIIHRYSDDDVRTLMHMNEISQKFVSVRNDESGDIFSTTPGEEQEFTETPMNILDDEDDETFVIADI